MLEELILFYSRKVLDAKISDIIQKYCNGNIIISHA